MNREIEQSVIALLERARGVGQVGSRAMFADVVALNRECGGILPDWYIDLITAYPICGLELGWLSSTPGEEDDGVSWMTWSAPAGMRSEMVECYPGIAICKLGYFNVAGCSHGSGDQYFMSARKGDDPPVIQVAHDVSDDAEVILRNGMYVVAERLSELFTNALVRSSRDGEG
jgi:hypothetical protein